MIDEIFRRSWIVWYYVRMLTYFDECYDGGHWYLVLGALFNPSSKKIHRDFLEEKRTERYFKKDGSVQEIKYNYCRNRKRLRVAISGVDCFKASSSYFRAIVVDQRPEAGYDLNFFGKPYEPNSLKKAKAYKKFAELLLKFNIPEIRNGVLLTDRLTRCKGDLFVPLMKELFGTPSVEVGNEPVFRHIQEVDTALEQYHVGQIGDILQGAILNELVPTVNEYKYKLREYVKGQLELPSLGRDYWQSLSKREQDQKHPKYQIWYWSQIK